MNLPNDTTRPAPADPSTDGAEQVVRRLPWWKKLVFALVPLVVLGAGGEIAFRIHYAREG